MENVDSLQGSTVCPRNISVCISSDWTETFDYLQTTTTILTFLFDICLCTSHLNVYTKGVLYLFVSSRYNLISVIGIVRTPVFVLLIVN